MRAVSTLRIPLWYTFAWWLALPLAAAYLFWRGLRQGAYRRHWAERFFGRGTAPADGGGPVIWVHAVSVGETRAAQPLVEALARRHPQASFMLTHMTPTGRAAGADLVRALPGRVRQRYLPYDIPCAVRRFLQETRPRLGVLMETEVWPNLLRGARRRGVPVMLANARLSPRSLAKAQRYSGLITTAASGLSAVGAQSAADGARLARLYEGPITVTGNLKFDMRPDERQLAEGLRWRAVLQARFAHAAGPRPIWLFASTREGEERLLLAALRQRASDRGTPPALLLFVPRHPQRFDEVAQLLGAQGAHVWPRSAWESQAGSRTAADPDEVLLGDSMGEMPMYYAMSDAALIGGSLLPLGGQNLIEACACGCPVVLGPHMFNFAQAASDAIEAGAARPASDAAGALDAMAAISAQPALRQAMSDAAQAFAATHRGATARTVALIEQLLDRNGSGL